MKFESSRLVLVVRRAPVWHYSQLTIPYLVTVHIIITTRAIQQPRTQTTGLDHVLRRQRNSLFNSENWRIAYKRTVLLPNVLHNSFIPQYCKPLKYNPDLNIEELSSSGNESSIVVTAYLHEGLELTDGYECYVIIRAPEKHGIVTTVKKISFHDNDTLVFQRSSNTENDVWLQQDEDNKYKEILSLPQEVGQSSIRMRFKPSIKRSEHMAGFEIAFTSYRVKGDSCGEDFDCGNDRCISHDLQCDSYNNCGNDADEAGCAGVSLWIIILLVVLGILVVVLAITLWYRMAQR